MHIPNNLVATDRREGKVMTRTDAIWAAVMAAEDEHGEAAEAFARDEAAKASTAGDAERAKHWAETAEQLHALHTINRRWARPGQRPNLNS